MTHGKLERSKIDIFEVESKYPDLFASLNEKGMEEFIIPLGDGIKLTDIFYQGANRGTGYFRKKVTRLNRNDKGFFSPLAMKILRAAEMFGRFLTP